MRMILVIVASLILQERPVQAEPEQGIGLACKTKEAIEAVYKWGSEHMDDTNMQHGIAAVAPSDCVVRVMYFEKGDVVGHVTHGANEFDVVSIKVLADCQNGFCVWHTPTDMFTVFKSKSAPA